MSDRDNPFRAKCTAISKSTGKQCTHWAIRGGTVCRHHGGGAPQVRAAANRRLEAAELARLTERSADALLIELEQDAAGRSPAEILLDAVYRCYAMVQLLGATVGALQIPSPGEAIPEQGASTLYVAGHVGTGHPHVALALYETWLERAARTAKLALDAGVAEALVRIEQDKGRLLAQIISAVIDDPDLGLTDDRKAVGRAIAARHLRLLDAG